MTTVISADQRLAILRESDGSRLWRTLDERRICLRCSRVFSGQEVTLTTDDHGCYQLHCPTDGCESSLGDWFFFGNGLASDHPGMIPPYHAEMDFNFG